MKPLKLISLLVVFTLLTGCAALFHPGGKWKTVSYDQYAFSVKMPADTRHFYTNSSNYKIGYQQWSASLKKAKLSFFLITSEISHSSNYSSDPAQLLKSAQRPQIGFLAKATVTQNQMLNLDNRLVEEQYWRLENKTQQAVSRTCIHKDRIYQLICVYPHDQEFPALGKKFFNSFQLK